MAKKISDPDFNIGYALPEGVVNDFNLFIKPQKVQQNPAVQNLISSLSNIVPTLATYDVIEEVQNKKINESKAVEDYNLNKNAFANLVQNKKIPAGANPHYFNKMMELDLASKAKDFQRKFDTYYADNDLKNQLNPDSLKDAYEAELKDFYNKNNLDGYDPLALNKAFFSTTSKYRDDLEKKHNANRYKNIEDNTKQLAIKNYAGSFIDFQYKKSSIDEVHNFIKSETADYISLTKNPRIANELFIAGLTNYVGAVNTEEGFTYAKKIVDSLTTLKLGTGDFAGSNRAKFIQKKLQNELTSKELLYLDKQNKFRIAQKKVEQDKLEDDYYAFQEQAGAAFNIYDMFETLDGDSDFAQDKYNSKQKSFLLKFHNGQVNALKVTSSSPDAIVELSEMKISNPYEVKDKAIEFLNNGQLTIADYQSFSKTAGNYDILKDNVFFQKSARFKNLRSFFKSPELAKYPSLRTEIPLLENEFEEKVIQYFNSIKDLEISAYDKQKRLDDEIYLILGDALQNSLIFSNTAGKPNSLLRKIVSRYGITLR